MSIVFIKNSSGARLKISGGFLSIPSLYVPQPADPIYLPDLGTPALNGASLQAAINLCVGGEIIELQAQTDYLGPITYPAGLTSDVIIRTRNYGGGSWPVNGRRIRRAIHVSLMARIIGVPPVVERDSSSACYWVDNTEHWILHGVIIQSGNPGTFNNFNANLFWGRHDYLNPDDPEGGPRTAPIRPDAMPDNNKFRHCIFCGDANYGTGNGITLVAKNTVIQDCSFDYFQTAVPFGITFKTSNFENQCINDLVGYNTVVENCYIEGSNEPIYIGGIDSAPYITENSTLRQCRTHHPKWVYIWGPDWGTSRSEISANNGWYAEGSDLQVISVSPGTDRTVVKSVSHPFTSADVSKGLRVPTASTGFTPHSIYTGISLIVSVDGSGNATVSGTSFGIAGATGGAFRKDVIYGQKNEGEFKNGYGWNISGCILGDNYIQGQPNTFAGAQVYNQDPPGNVVITNTLFYKIPNFTSISFYADRQPEGWTLTNVMFIDLDGQNRAQPYTKFIETTWLKTFHVTRCTIMSLQEMIFWWVHYVGSNKVHSDITIKDNLISASVCGAPTASDWAGPVWLALTDGNLGDAVSADISYNCIGGGSLNSVNDVLEDNKWPKKAVSVHNQVFTHAQILAELVDPENGNYRIKDGSFLLTASSTGGPVGADQDAIWDALSPDDQDFILTIYSGFAG